MKIVKEFRLKVEGAGKGRPFDMVELEDGSTMKKVEYAKTEDGKVYVKAQKAQKKAEKAVADQAKAPIANPVVVGAVAIAQTLAPNVEA
jgi:Pyruvate/2-oxoacid:ferredoxin oxidoreductase gamma subunit